ncbi:NUDIX domain-containing protein [bacterium]|nr:NUDIX domain-containing protein [bacterium]
MPQNSGPGENRHILRTSYSHRRTTRRSHSAGGVAYQVAPGNSMGDVQIALIATNQGERWQLPKGRLEPGEEPLQAAIREVLEETGLVTEHEAFLKTIEYRYVDTYSRVVPELVIKRVDFYLLRVVGGNLNSNSYEVDDVAWRTPVEALTQLTFTSEQECVRLAQEHWK